MGYETKMYVVRQIDSEYGIEIASLDLCKCGDGPVAKLIASSIQKANKSEKHFCLWPRNPDRQQEAVDLIQGMAILTERNEEISKMWHDTFGEDLPGEMRKLAAAIEDGRITKDHYGDYLPVIDVDDMIAALKEDIAKDGYRRFELALIMLEAIQKWQFPHTDLKVVTYGH